MSVPTQPRTSPSPRRSVVATAAAVAVGLVLALLALGGCDSGGHRTAAVTRGAGSFSGRTAPVRSRGERPLTGGTGRGRAGAIHLAPLGRLAGARLRAALAGDTAALGPNVGIAVQDLSTGQRLVDTAAGVARPPASVEKLYTSAAMLWMLGPEAQLHTELLGSGNLGPHGVWHGDLYLVGDGDPTFGDGAWNAAYDKGQGPTVTELLADLAADGIRAVTGRIYADPYRFDAVPGGFETAGAPDLPDYMGQMSALVYDHGLTLPGLTPATTAVHEIALAARAAGVKLTAAVTPAAAPADVSLLGDLSSPRLPVLLRLMDVPSDDLFADLFAKQLGYHFEGSGTLAAGAQVIRQTILAHYGIRPTVYDGSGLDHADRSTPDGVLSMLAQMYGTPIGSIVRGAMPVIGRSGTVAGVGLHTPAVGRCQAKTGTLATVANLAGYCDTASGHTLAYVFFIDGPPFLDGKAAFSSMVAAIADY